MKKTPRIYSSAIAATIGGILLAGCSPTTTTSDSAEATDATVSTDSTASNTAVPAVRDSSALHTFEIDYDEGDYESLISSYLESGEKVWISASVIIDGQTFDDVGLKLKGNFSLRGLSEDEGASISTAYPEDLPWVIRLDKYVDDQELDGATEFVVRGNTSQTSLNEAVALDLLDNAGLAAEEAISAEVSFGDSDPALRLVIENPNTAWMERELGNGYLWKSESGGSWAYIDEQTESYVESFDQEGGDDNYEPLISFLQFVNESDDDTFGTDLDQWLDVGSFATYLAYQTVVNNFDDIDGPGNNSYLYWDIDTEQMTVVNWDLNLAFGARNEGEGGQVGGAVPGAERGDRTIPTDGAELPDDTAIPQRGERPTDATLNDAVPDAAGGGQAGPPADGGNAAGGNAGGGGNVLSERFLANADFTALYDAEVERQTDAFFANGQADTSLDAWVNVLGDDAAALIEPLIVEEEAEALRANFTV